MSSTYQRPAFTVDSRLLAVRVKGLEAFARTGRFQRNLPLGADALGHRLCKADQLVAPRCHQHCRTYNAAHVVERVQIRGVLIVRQLLQQALFVHGHLDAVHILPCPAGSQAGVGHLNGPAHQLLQCLQLAGVPVVTGQKVSAGVHRHHDHKTFHVLIPPYWHSLPFRHLPR